MAGEAPAVEPVDKPGGAPYTRMVSGGKEVSMLGRFERGGSGEAVVEYGDSNLRVVKPGRFVRCAVTGVEIPLDALRYWSVERQEAYADPDAVMVRLRQNPLHQGSKTA